MWLNWLEHSLRVREILSSSPSIPTKKIMQFPTYKREEEKIQNGFDFIIGCDEVGAGPLAGPVVAAACILKSETIGDRRTSDKWYYRVRDSKTVSEKEREELAVVIKQNCLCYAVSEVDSREIDDINIHNASLLAMHRAVSSLLEQLNTQDIKKIFVFVDGKFRIKGLSLEQEPVISGDSEILSIAAASIIAKVHRDGLLRNIDKVFPNYGFAKHKGYGTREHIQAIQKNGVLGIHRKSFLKNII